MIRETAVVNVEGAVDLALAMPAQDLLFRSARTVGKFRAEPVTDEQIRAIYDLVKYAPTSLNQQPLRVVLVRSTEARRRLVSHMWDANKEKTMNAPLSMILAADLHFHDELPRVFPHKPEARYLFADQAVRVESARLNAALQVGYFILGVRAAGLAAGPMVGFDVKGVNEEFFGDGHHTALVVMNIGVPDGEPLYPRLPRLDYEEVFTTV
jgi:3-hydroxypropanoate dehydrogenase